MVYSIQTCLDVHANEKINFKQQDLLPDGKNISDSIAYLRESHRMDKRKSFVFGRQCRNCFYRRINALLPRN